MSVSTGSSGDLIKFDSSDEVPEDGPSDAAQADAHVFSQKTPPYINKADEFCLPQKSLA
jgi:hypothetical protein